MIDRKSFQQVRHPKHYCKGTIETIDYILDIEASYCIGNTIKYLSRYRYKENPKQDLEKALQYLKFERDKKDNKKSRKLIESYNSVDVAKDWKLEPEIEVIFHLLYLYNSNGSVTTLDSAIEQLTNYIREKY